MHKGGFIASEAVTLFVKQTHWICNYMQMCNLLFVTENMASDLVFKSWRETNPKKKFFIKIQIDRSRLNLKAWTMANRVWPVFCVTDIT